jgi:hypothetical protein
MITDLRDMVQQLTEQQAEKLLSLKAMQPSEHLRILQQRLLDEPESNIESIIQEQLFDACDALRDFYDSINDIHEQ